MRAVPPPVLTGAPAAPAGRYGTVAIALHWLLAIALVGQVVFGWTVHDIPRGTPLRGPMLNWHKSVGIVIGLLVLFRLGWRLAHPPPPLPASMPAWKRRAAGASHVLLYACMVLLPLTAYVASNLSRHGVKFFNLVTLPPWGPELPAVYSALSRAHALLATLLVILVAVHVLAALHHLVRRDGLFDRMRPGAARACSLPAATLEQGPGRQHDQSLA